MQRHHKAIQFELESSSPFLTLQVYEKAAVFAQWEGRGSRMTECRELCGLALAFKTFLLLKAAKVVIKNREHIQDFFSHSEAGSEAELGDRKLEKK